MKRIPTSMMALGLLMVTAAAQLATAAIDVQQEQPLIPVMINTPDSPVLWLNVVGDRPTLEQVQLNLAGTSHPSDVQRVKIYSIGSEQRRNRPASAVLFGTVEPENGETALTVSGTQELSAEKDNWFLITVTLAHEADLRNRLNIRCKSVTAGGQTVQPDPLSAVPLRLGYRLRHQGDDGSQGYRIPGLGTTEQGTLLAIYDIRRPSNRDLQGDLDIGLSRSTDGGQTWEPMRTVLDMGTWGDLPQKFNGVSDAGILVDDKSHRVFVFGCWMYGLRNKDGSFRTDLTEASDAWAHQWHRGMVGSGPGRTPRETAQFLMTYSDDDGQTWSKPQNLTTQLKRPEWYLFCTAPGKGFTADDGTLVMPVQGRNHEQESFSTIMTSTDRGETWTVGKPARLNTTESAAAQLSDGSILLNMRDNRNRRDKSASNGRAVAVTSDWGTTWTKHSSDHRADLMPEPTCMASLIHTDVQWQGQTHRLLLFSNPNNRSERRNMTIKLSSDQGVRWPRQHWIELDALKGGYSCLTRIDQETIGIQYESSQGYLVFQKIPIRDFWNAD